MAQSTLLVLESDGKCNDDVAAAFFLNELLCFSRNIFCVTLVCRFHHYSVSFFCITSSIISVVH